MKKVIVLLFVLINIVACKKDNETTSTTPPPNPEAPTGMLIASAKIVEGTTPGDKANGNAMIYNNNGKWSLYLTNFTSNAGPDLRVYLATSANANSFIDLGTLKSTSGNQQYDIAGTPDLATYKYVLVWCKKFSIYFGGGQFN